MPTILTELNWIDLFFLILLLGMIYKGVRSGVAGQVVPLVGTFVLVFLSVGYYKSSSEAFFGYMLQDWAKPVSFFLICSLVLFVSKIIEKLFHFTSSEDMAMIERLAGIVMAVLRTVMLCGAVSLFLLLVPVKTVNNAVKEESKAALHFAKIDIRIYRIISDLLNKKAKIGQNLTLEEFTGTGLKTGAKIGGEKNET